ncbi:transcriptional regulator, LuxR family protein [Rubellimicrobium mesophilum DSM 19309]|uniref:Transcriptional regulator, LuxR family protein n=1 Tax=Rubellimicrobium mesophilum DSM 19309 TaxID=442562 RepID=A0A017HRH5_9RHOB|nr:autoinducer binding domain-containing protein [Rubellimicrobium mesophilum]EYD77067.1 transcriptional regulator, LuxR family protein [Rubellimicrobium mesophilum DSM 19309]
MEDILSIDLPALANAGYYIALRIGFAFPKEEVNALPPAWIERYTREGYMMSDPVLRWIYDGEGLCRWSAVPFPDPRGIMAAARLHGLVHGVAVSLRDSAPSGQRSFGSFARSDREFTDLEAQALLAYVRARHDALSPPRNITRAELEALRLIKNGQRLKQIAHLLGVSEGAVKQRLKNARLKLDAKTGAEAISRAAAFGLI